MNVIFHKNDNGDNAITYIAKGFSVQQAQKEIGGIEISEEIDSINHKYLNAYDIVNGSINLDLEKARELKVDFIRQERDLAFADFDKRYDIAIKDEVDLDQLKLERQKLKDAPQSAIAYLDSCISLTEIDNLQLKTLL